MDPALAPSPSDQSPPEDDQTTSAPPKVLGEAFAPAAAPSRDRPPGAHSARVRPHDAAARPARSMLDEITGGRDEIAELRLELHERLNELAGAVRTAMNDLPLVQRQVIALEKAVAANSEELDRLGRMLGSVSNELESAVHRADAARESDTRQLLAIETAIEAAMSEVRGVASSSATNSAGLERVEAALGSITAELEGLSHLRGAIEASEQRGQEESTKVVRLGRRLDALWETLIGDLPNKTTRADRLD